MHAFRITSLMLGLMAASGLDVDGADIKLEWVPEGMSAKAGYYKPLKVELSAAKPSQVVKGPDNISNPLFGTALFGLKESPLKITFLLDEPDSGAARLWVDANANGDLTDDPDVELVAHYKNGKNAPATSWSGSAGISVGYGPEQRLLGIKLYKNDNMKNALAYYRDFGFAGSVAIGGKTFQAALVDDSARGDFQPGADIVLLIDLNNNGKFERKGEAFVVNAPFNIAGTTYEIAGLTIAGDGFQLVKSSKVVEETVPPPALEVGNPAIAFEEKASPAKPVPEDPLGLKARALAKANKLLAIADFEALRKTPRPASISVAAALNQPLSGREIAARAAQAYVRAGWIYRCSKCSQWHLKLAGGYAVAKDAVATAFHVMATPDKIKQGEGWPVIVRGDDEVIPVLTVLAANEAADTIILRVAAADLYPLPLSVGAKVGDAVYCYSDPRDAHGYFSSGIINRFYIRGGGSAANPADQRINVSTDWAPGSSGAAIFDNCGNVIGHVARIQPLFDKKQAAQSDEGHEEASSTIMTLHEAISARAVLDMIDQMKVNAGRK